MSWQLFWQFYENVKVKLCEIFLLKVLSQHAKFILSIKAATTIYGIATGMIVLCLIDAIEWIE